MTRAKGTGRSEAVPAGAQGAAEGAGASEGAGGANGAVVAEGAAAPDAAPEGAASVRDLIERAEAELAKLDAELGEIDMLVSQARTEAGRQETRRAQAAEKLEAAKADPKETADLASQLVALTRRASVMQAQVEILEGKHGALSRYREGLAGHAASLRMLSGGAVGAWLPAVAPGSGAESEAASAEADAAALPPAISRVVLAAQEDLRREIARSMHDGPAQSLTNIVLQAQIVERLLDRDPAAAKREIALLGGMVQQTLEATKSFIFDVRPMVLDDLGLVPTLRRSAREHGRKAGLTVAFDSVGADRRLGVDVESALFRIVDEALAAFLEQAPERATILLDWNDRLRLEVAASRPSQAEAAEEAAAPAPKADVPPALAAMIEERRARARAAAPGPVQLPATTWRAIQGRARTIGASAELLDDGGRLVVEAPLPESG